MTKSTSAFRTSAFKTSLAALAGCAFAAASAGTAAAITSKNFKYLKPKTGYYSIHPAALAADSSAATNYSINVGTASLSVGQFSCFNTGVHVPNNAKLTHVKVYYSSNDKELGIRVHRSKLSNGNSDAIVKEPVSDASPDRKATQLQIPRAFATVKNAKFAYSFTVCVTPGAKFHGAQIRYVYRYAGD